MQHTLPSQLTLFFLLCFSLLALGFAQAIDTGGITEYRSADGSFNHYYYPSLGATDTPLIRISGSGYGNGYDLPRGVPYEGDGDGNIEIDEQLLVSPRKISNRVHDQGTKNLPSTRGLNQLFFQFGQFLSHDTGLSEADPGVSTGGSTGVAGNESFPIQVPSNDPDFDFAEIPLTRSISLAAHASPSGLREQINLISTFIDGSNVYGSDSQRALALRTLSGGRLRVQPGPDGDLPPFNTFGLSNANPLHLPESSLFAAGDVRSNEQVGLTAFHTLFIREHNRLAGEIAASDFPGANLNNAAIDEEIYQRARATMSALLQNITYYEWLPALLGPNALSTYQGYRPGVDPRISAEFSTAAFRIGHTMLPSRYLVTNRVGEKTILSLRNAFFAPSYILQNGISDIIRGQALHPQQELDRFVVDEVRNFLFGPGFGGLDLASLNIQRGREHGLPGYNAVRSALGLQPAYSYYDITGNNPAAANALAAAYGPGPAGLVDLWTGGLSEPQLPGSSLGETFTVIFVDQFSRLRDGDRFYFENRNIYPDAFINAVRNTTLADIIRRNSGVRRGEINESSFFVPGERPYQPDLRVGRKRNNLTHIGDDRYNVTGAGQRIRVRASSSSWATSFASLENDGANSSLVRLTAKTPSKRKFRTRYFEFENGVRRNITADLVRQNYGWHLQPSEMVNLQARVRLIQAARKNTNLLFRSQSLEDTTAIDTAKARLAFR